MLLLKQMAQLLGWWTVLLAVEGVNMCKLTSATSGLDTIPRPAVQWEPELGHHHPLKG